MNESTKRLKAALGTLAVCTAVFFILLFTMAWTNAGSGPGEYPGIEVNLGYDDQGSGNDQPDAPIGREDATDTEDPPVKTQEPEAAKPETQAPPVTENTEAKIVQPTTVTDPNSDVDIKAETKEVKPAEKTPEKKAPVEKPVEKPVERPREVDQKAVYKGGTNSNAKTGENGEGKQGTTGNEGDDAGKQGDKGVPGGTEGAAVYKGTPGGGDGGSIVLNGWDWDHIPKVQAADNETGRIVYEIQVDENGELIGLQKIEGSASPATEKKCRDAIQRISFTKRPGAKVPDVSKGRITFVIRAQ